jgi:hypothetical protein
MPTGYTYPIEEDPEFTFEHFVWKCAEAFLIEMRDRNGRIPERFELDSYGANRIQQAKDEIARLQALTLEKAVAVATEHFKDASAEWEQADIERQKHLAAYLKMEAAVEEWEPQGDDFQGLTDFMIEQLQTSYAGLKKPYAKPTPPPTLEEARAWIDRRIEWAKKDLERAEESHRKAVENNAAKNDWLARLRASVPQP